jgi:post-segregation antitoxin (ccd killing protein)
MAVVISVSVPDQMHARWKESGLGISPSALFQTALETELSNTNQHVVYWSTRALAAEKKLKVIHNLLEAPDKEIKKIIMLEKLTES